MIQIRHRRQSALQCTIKESSHLLLGITGVDGDLCGTKVL
jgi:hypothetical protein